MLYERAIDTIHIKKICQEAEIPIFCKVATTTQDGARARQKEYVRRPQRTLSDTSDL